MARTQVAADFEEGSNGAAVDPAAADKHDLGLVAAPGSTITYTSEPHEGALAARLAGTSTLILQTDQSLESARGGGFWLKVKSLSSPPTGSTELLARIEVFDGLQSFGVYMVRSGSNFRIYSQDGDVIIATIAQILDQWIYFSLAPNGRWELGTDTSLILAGVEPVPSNNTPVLISMQMGAYSPGGVTLVDDIWVAYGPPAVRLFPRDDGRGMSSAPRIWPPTKAARIIGGFQ